MFDRLIATEVREVDASTNIAHQIRELISRGILSSGFRLGQKELAEHYNVSRTQIRETLQTLAAEEIVTHNPNRGYFIARISSQEARELYRMRHIFEIDLLSTIKWPTAKILTELKAQVKKTEAIVAQQEFERWQQSHRQFQMMIFNLSPHKIYVHEVFRLWALTDRYYSLLSFTMQQDRGFIKAKMAAMRRLIGSLTGHDHMSLLRVFEEERDNIEEMLISALGSRGL